jgi:hypothetical protein
VKGSQWDDNLPHYIINECNNGRQTRRLVDMEAVSGSRENNVYNIDDRVARDLEIYTHRHYTSIIL